MLDYLLHSHFLSELFKVFNQLHVINHLTLSHALQYSTGIPRTRLKFIAKKTDSLLSVGLSNFGYSNLRKSKFVSGLDYVVFTTGSLKFVKGDGPVARP
jgi:hypothetical protein